MGIFREIRRCFKDLDSSAKTQAKLAKKSAIGSLWAIPYSISKGFDAACNVFSSIIGLGSDAMGYFGSNLGFAGAVIGTPIIFTALAVATFVAATTFTISALTGSCIAAGLAVTSALSTVAAIGSKCIEKSVELLTGENQPPKYRTKSYPKPSEENKKYHSKSSPFSPSTYPKPTGFASILADKIKSIFR